jgi:GT2 family glycosyltransferase
VSAATVCAVVVTRDRRALLRECLSALQGQTRPPDDILVVDNASSDGTSEMLAADFPEVRVRRLDTNEGGAGGFHEGMRDAYEGEFEWLWVMDDDTIPTPTALEQLLDARDTAAALGQPPSVLASRVVWDDGRLHRMNKTALATNRMDNLVDAASHGLLMIRSASFVSLLVKRTAIERYGLPIKRYFIWTDDIEFTARILRWESGYLVPESVVHHKTAGPGATAEGPRERFFYYVRNTLYMTRGPAWDTGEKLRLLWRLLTQIRRFLRHNRWSPGAALVVARGIAHGVATPADDG